ncbi:asparagine synthase-related protein [Amycolatopsis sp. YIM 10]|uniref:asparagine synthase-related protein n=1 Tax=Amycolatopsis sp. YIM 10 TaxID=2653857 RepID=UPI00128FE0E8|nr:asparagine synthase-related protein [Amycolatopsis sp. YIM 10]QFU91024.1 Putative asparagine synthetase [glutamine-hydrolyzing] [Amycolatopsis sp. YIM 10]
MKFTIFPDSDPGRAVAESAEPSARTIAYPSGRPWIAGEWRDDEIVSTRIGDRVLVLLGWPGITEAKLRSELERVEDLSQLDRLAGALPGSSHLLAAFGGRVRAQGTISAVCQIYYTRVRGTTVLADRPQTLAALAGTGLDESLLARYLMVTAPPWPLEDECAWHGIERVPPDAYLTMKPDGGCRISAWWTIPEPELPLREGAAAVRAALEAGVAARASLPGRTSSDLSGGMDSTSLAFLLAKHPGELLTTRFEAVDSANDDVIWASKAAADLPDAEHLVIARDDAPMNLAGALTPEPDAEGPSSWLRTHGLHYHHVRLLAEHGVARHLTGHGGDELFYVMPQHDHSLLRTAPLSYLPHLRSNLSLRRWTLGRALRFLADNTSYRRWLADCARTLTEPLPKTSDPSMGWGEPPRMPPWTTSRAVELNRALLLAAARRAPKPLSPLRAQHATLDMVRVCGDGVRRASWMSARHDVSWHAPFVDDRVVEAALSIRLQDRVAANRYKPVLAEAMRPVVPGHVLGRPTKGEFSADVYAGFAHHKRELLEQCEQLELERFGLVDADAFRRALLAPHPASRDLMPLLGTLACEAWLRSVAALTTTTGGKS